MKVIQDCIVYPLLEQEFMSTMDPSDHAHRIQQLAESPFTPLAKAEAVTSAASLHEAIHSFCPQPSIIPPNVSAHNYRLYTDI